MINQIQSIKTFLGNHIADLAPVMTIDKDPLGNEIANGDQASVVVAVKDKGRYRIRVTSAYIEPPLGKVTMTNLATQQTIEANKGDEVWRSIAAHIRGAPLPEKEEATPNVLPLAEPEVPHDGRVPHLSQGVIFITERGEAIGGMDELAALVTKIESPVMVSLTVFPCTGESFWRDRVLRRSEKLRRNCWDFADKPPLIMVPEGFELPDDIDPSPGHITWIKSKERERKRA